MKKTQIVIFFVLSHIISFSQNNNNEIDLPYKIEWVKTYPLSSKEKKKKIIKRTIDLILGEEEELVKKPIGIIAENPENVWIADQGRRNFINIKNGMGEIPRFIKKKKLHLPSLVGICYIKDNVFLGTDSYLNKIIYVSEKKNEINFFADTVKLYQPTGIAYSRETKCIYVVETAAHQISVFDENGKLINIIGGRGVSDGKFNYPTLIWIDNLGTIYVIDSMNFRVQIFDKNGNHVKSFGENGDASGYFARPKGVATDSYGNIYIADALFHTIQIFDKKGNFLYNIGKQGRENSEFWMPVGIYIDENDFLYVADSYNSRIQIFKISKAK